MRLRASPVRKRKFLQGQAGVILRLIEGNELLGEVLKVVRLAVMNSKSQSLAVSYTTSLRGELDSLDLIQVVVACENHFGVEFEYEAMIAIDTVTDIASAIDAQLGRARKSKAAATNSMRVQ